MVKKDMILGIVYAVLAMVLVSLNNTYNITYGIFGKLLGAGSQDSYGKGNTFKNPGFLLHILVFAILIAIPCCMNK